MVTVMSFNYSMYQRGCLVIPMILIIFSLCLLASNVFSVLKNIRNKKIREKIILSIMVSLLCIYTIIMSLGKLTSGGLEIIVEKEDDAVEISGNVQNIDNIGKFELPLFNLEYGYGESSGVEITIEGVVVKGPGCILNYVKTDDTVTIVYLPKSGYILSIYNQCQ